MTETIFTSAALLADKDGVVQAIYTSPTGGAEHTRTISERAKEDLLFTCLKA